MWMIVLAVVWVLSTTAALAGADDSALVEGHGIAIGQADLAMELQLLTPEQRTRVLENSGELQNTITRIFFRRRMAQLAEEQGYLDEPRVQARLRLEQELVLGRLVPDRFVAGLEMPDFESEARAYYEENLREFTPEETVRASHILLKAPSDADRDRRRPEADALLQRLREGEDFGELAFEYSEDGSRFLAGDLGFFGSGRMVPEFEEVAFGLAEPGELSGVVETRFGLHIIRLTDRTEPEPRAFEEVRQGIVERMRAEYRDAQLSAWLREVASPSIVAVSEETLDATREALRQEWLHDGEGGDRRVPH